MEIKSLDAASICRIIRESAKSGVKELQIGDLKIQFGSDGKLELPKKTDEQQGELFPLELAPARQPEKSDSIDVLQTYPFTDEQREVMESFTETQLMIDDPLMFEQQYIDSEFQGQRVRGNGQAFDRGSQ